MNTFYNLHYFNFFDATTIAIMIPTVVMAFLILVCGIKKHYWVLRPAELSINAAGSGQRSADDGRIAFAIKRLDIYLYGLILANVQAAIFLSSVSYAILPGDSFHSFLFRHLTLMLWGVVISILDVVPLLALVQVLRARRAQFIPAVSPRHPARFVFGSMVFIFLALWIVPLSQAELVLFGVLPGYPDLLKDVFRVCIAFSTVPLSLMGMIAAFTSNSTFACERAKQRLHLQSLSPECLSALEEERLHKIADDARLAQNFEAAEIVSLHLLERAEASMKAF
ncbi:MAG: hypothetical protein WC028_12760 [Candidatus Obscuribacterales bacterium]